MKRLNDKVAVITGAGRGIGREHALYFASQGARVVINDPGCDTDGSNATSIAQQVVDEIQALGGEAVADMSAVGTSAAAEQIVETAIETFGRIDILVNNAGILRDRTILKMTDEEWDTEMELLKKALAPKKISPLVAFLATDAAAGISGMTFGVEGNEIFTYRMMTSHGVTRYQQNEWTIEAIEKSIGQIIHW